MNNNSKLINAIIKKEITSKGLTFKFVSSKTGIKYDRLISYLSKNYKIDILDYFSICSFLNIEPTSIINEIKK